MQTLLGSLHKEDKKAALFEMNEKPLRELTWWWVRKMAALKPLRVVWPANWDTVYTISVDGMHRCPVIHGFWTMCVYFCFTGYTMLEQYVQFPF